MSHVTYHLMRFFRMAIKVKAVIAGASLLVMMVITCLDVVLRQFSLPIKGTVDLVQILATLAIAGALPYTTARKGHVAIEFFVRKLPKKLQVSVDSVMRVLCIGLLLMCGYGCIGFGYNILANGQVSATLQAPIFWVPWYLSLACVMTALVIVYHLVRPNKALLP